MTANDTGARLVVMGVKKIAIISGVRRDIHSLELSVKEDCMNIEPTI
jgi:hypothetical protein